MTIWKNEAARERLKVWDAKFLAKVSTPYFSRVVQTEFGRGRVLMCGNKAQPVLCCLHAMRTGGGHLLSEIEVLAQNYFLIIPDLPNQSVYGVQERMELDDAGLAHWLKQVIDSLGYSRVSLFGVSWGGFVAQKFAMNYYNCVEHLVLLVPAGIVKGNSWQGLRAMIYPMLRYKLFPSRGNLKAMLSPLLTEWDDDWGSYMADSLKDMVMDLRIPPLFSDDELKLLRMPVLVIAGEEDLSFPGRSLILRVEKLVEGCETELLQAYKHCPPSSESFRHWLSSRMSQFLMKAGSTK